MNLASLRTKFRNTCPLHEYSNYTILLNIIDCLKGLRTHLASIVTYPKGLAALASEARIPFQMLFQFVGKSNIGGLWEGTLFIK